LLITGKNDSRKTDNKKKLSHKCSFWNVKGSDFIYVIFLYKKQLL